MTQQNESSKVVLIVAGAGLVLLTVVLLFALRDDPTEELTPNEDPRSERYRPRAASPTPLAPTRPAPSVRPTTATSAPVQTPPGEPRVVRVPAAGPTPTRGNSLSERHTRAMAPAAVPSEIEQESNPQRKMQLVKMHELATERVRVGMLRRRARMLSDTMRDTSGREKSAIDAQKRDLAELRKAVTESEEKVKDLMQQVAGGTSAAPSVTPFEPELN